MSYRQAQRLHGEVAGSRLEILRGGSHMVHHIAPERIVHAIDLSPRRARHGSPRQAERSTNRAIPPKGIAEACTPYVGRSHRHGGADRHQPGSVWTEKAGTGRTDP